MTRAFERGDGEIIQRGTAMVSDDSVVLLVSLQDSATDLPIESIPIEEFAETLLDEIPTTDAREYRTAVVSPPHHGKITPIAEDDQHAEIDSLGIEYNCTVN